MAESSQRIISNRRPLNFAGEPAFAVRGFMLDISRGKVPTRESFAELIQILGNLRYNHLQLYTEHAFAFSKHQRVWRGASPLTAADIRWLQSLCAQRDIELAANFNSFGHFERWLKHPQYKHLAECPDGFTHPLKGRVPHGTTLRPDTASLRFLDSLWKEYLPLFKSPRFNLGGDEPWELGQGWSKARVKKFGKHRVYLDFLKKLHQQAKKHGKEMLFWADILLEAPELVKEVPTDATALLWGYEADHPFAEQCEKLAAAKRKFWICPGASAWNTFTGRTDNMLANIESAAHCGEKYGAEGLLLTSWGDAGNHQPWPVMYPGLVYAAALAWNPQGLRRAELPRAINQTFSHRPRSGFGEALLELGRVENAITRPKPNRSRHHALFFATRAELAKELETLSASELKKSAQAIAHAKKKLPKKSGTFESGHQAEEELALGADLAAWALRRAQLAKSGQSTKVFGAELRRLIQRFKKIWRLRASPGGLAEAAVRMQEINQGSKA